MARRPLFLAPDAYRQRRLRDAARLLPVLGAVLLLLVPLLWGGGPGPRSGALVYVFVVWAGLVAAAALLGRRLDLSGSPTPSPGSSRARSPAPSGREEGPGP